MRDSGLTSISPNLAEIDLRPGQQVEHAAADHAAGCRSDRAGNRAGHHALDVPGEVFLDDAVLRAGSCDLAQVDAQFAGIGADRWRGVHFAAGRQGRGQRGGGCCGRRRCGGRNRGRCGGDWCRRCGLRGRNACGSNGFDLDQYDAFADLGAELDQHFLDRAGNGGRDVHGRLVGFERGDRVVYLDAVADLDEQVDDRHVGEVADVRHLDVDHATTGSGSDRGGSRYCSHGGRRGGLRCRCSGNGTTGFDLDQHDTFADLGTELDQDFLDHPFDGRRHVHRRLVGFERGDGVVDLDAVADLDEQVDDRNVGEVADIGDFDFNDLAHVVSP